MKKWQIYESMRNQGMTYQQIADACSCTRQNVHWALTRVEKAPIRGIVPSRCVYPALRNWMNDNRVTVAELFRRLYGDEARLNTRPRFYDLLKGKIDMKKRDIDALMRVTGMTYEELFR